jgi:phosphatidylglycerophosphate synthase
MRKINSNLENPFDNAIYIIVEYLAPYAHKFGFTPNMITTSSNLFTIIAIYYLLNYYFVVAAILYLISYMFDCLDGYVARKYNMVSIFGDYYDHISDAVKLIAYLGTLYLINCSNFFVASFLIDSSRVLSYISRSDPILF